MVDVTRLLDAAAAGDPSAADELLPLVYEELRKLAAVRLAREPSGNTLSPTSLVHEAYLRLVGGTPPGDWNGRAHFFGAAAEAMRRILVDRARRKQAEIHGGGRSRVDFHKVEAVTDLPPDRLIALDEALTRLAGHDVAAGQLVHLRYFGGLSVEEAAQAVGLSRATAYRHWAFARAWLVAQLADGTSDNSVSN